jgi:hypothetical protein
VDGDGKLDIVMTVKTLNPRGEWSTYIIAVSAVTGKDLAFFPIEFDSPLPLDDGMGDALLHMKLAQPLLVDLHADQSHWNSYLYRNGTAWQHPTKKKKGTEAPPHGGGAPGLHIVQPIGRTFTSLKRVLVASKWLPLEKKLLQWFKSMTSMVPTTWILLSQPRLVTLSLLSRLSSLTTLLMFGTPVKLEVEGITLCKASRRLKEFLFVM